MKSPPSPTEGFRVIPFNKASIGDSEIAYALQALRSGAISSSGDLSEAAQNFLSNMHNGADTLLTTSCTHALELSALLIRGIRSQGSQPANLGEIILPSFTFVSTALSFALMGFKPVFVDVRDDTLNIDERLVESKITSETRAICSVNYAGVGAEYEVLVPLAKEYGLELVEDNAHGLGGIYHGQTLGTFGGISVLSFHETKNISCGEGGAIVLNNVELTERAEILRDKGTNRRSFFRGEVAKYSWVDDGSSWGLSEILAGVLLGQLEKFLTVQNHRMSLWSRYFEELSPWADKFGFQIPRIPRGVEHTAHIFHVRAKSREEKERIMGALSEKGVSAVTHYQSLHDSPAGKKWWSGERLPVTERASETLFRLPLFHKLTEDDVSHVCDLIRRAT